MAALVIAHRTCPRHEAENSLAGIRRAAELGADVVEVDARRTLDGVPVLMHDPFLGRTTGLWLPVLLLPSWVVRRRRLKNSTERVPALADGLAALPEHLRIAIDIKHPSAAAAIVREVRGAGVADRTLLWSQHERAVAYAAQHAPDMETGLLRDTRTPDQTAALLDDAGRLGAGGISAHWDVVTRDLLEDAHARGLRVYSWCQYLPETQQEKIAMGLDGVVTDWVEEARAAS